MYIQHWDRGHRLWDVAGTVVDQPRSPSSYPSNEVQHRMRSTLGMLGADIYICIVRMAVSESVEFTRGALNPKPKSARHAQVPRDFVSTLVPGMTEVTFHKYTCEDLLSLPEKAIHFEKSNTAGLRLLTFYRHNEHLVGLRVWGSHG